MFGDYWACRIINPTNIGIEKTSQRLCGEMTGGPPKMSTSKVPEPVNTVSWVAKDTCKYDLRAGPSYGVIILDSLVNLIM